MNGSLKRSAGWLISGAVVQSGIAFIANIFLMRMLFPEDFGRYAIIQANIGLIGSLLNLRISDVALRTPKDELTEKTLSILSSALLIQTVIIGIATSLSVYITGMFSIEAIILIAGLLISNWTTYYIKLYERSFKYRGVTFVESGSAITANVLAVIGAASGMGAIVLYLRDLLRVFIQLIALSIMGAIRFSRVIFIRLDSWVFIRRNVSGLWIDGMLEQSFHRLIILVVGVLAGEQGAGYFFQARRLAMVPHEITQPVTFRLAFNYFSHRVRGHLKVTRLKKLLTIELLVISPIVFLALILLKPLIPIVFGERWVPIIETTYYLAGFMVFITLFNTVKSYYMSEKSLFPFMIIGRSIQYLGLLVGIAISYYTILLPYNSLAIGLSFSYVIGTFGLNVYLEKYEKILKNII